MGGDGIEILQGWAGTEVKVDETFRDGCDFYLHAGLRASATTIWGLCMTCSTNPFIIITRSI